MKGRQSLLETLSPGILSSLQNIDACTILCLLSIGPIYRFNVLWSLALAFLLYTFTLQVASQIALSTGMGLAENIKREFNGRVVSLTVFTSLLANISLISAQLAGMAVALSILFKISLPLAAVVSTFIVFAVAYTKTYNLIDRVLIVLSFMSVAYFIVAYNTNPNLSEVMIGFVKLNLTLDEGYWIAVLAILGIPLGPNALFYEAGDLAQKGVKKESLVKVMVSPFIGSIVSLAIGTAILICGANLSIVSENLIEVVEAFKSCFGEASALTFSLGLFAGSLLTAVVNINSTSYILSETYGHKGVVFGNGDKSWAMLVVVLTLGGLPPLLLVGKPVKVAMVASVLSSLTTILPLILLIKLYCNRRVMKGFEAKGFTKASSWFIASSLVFFNIAGLAVIVYNRPLLGYVTIPLDFIVILAALLIAMFVFRALKV